MSATHRHLRSHSVSSCLFCIVSTCSESSKKKFHATFFRNNPQVFESMLKSFFQMSSNYPLTPVAQSNFASVVLKLHIGFGTVAKVRVIPETDQLQNCRSHRVRRQPWNPFKSRNFYLAHHFLQLHLRLKPWK